jgi:hypothetical protein
MITTESIRTIVSDFFTYENKLESEKLSKYLEVVEEVKQWLGKSPKIPEFREAFSSLIENLGKSKDSRFNFTSILRVNYYLESEGIAKAKAFGNISSLLEACSILKHSGIKNGPDALVFSGPPNATEVVSSMAGKSVKAIRESLKAGKPEAGKAEAKAEAKPLAKPENDEISLKIKYCVDILSDELMLTAFLLRLNELGRLQAFASRVKANAGVHARKSKLPTRD